MPKSRVRGVDRIAARFEGSVSAVELEMAEANRDSVLIIQRHVVAGVPVKTGETGAAFAHESAVGISRKYRGGWRFGLITRVLKKIGWKAHFIEFGTKGYKVGDKRRWRQRAKAGSQRIGKNGQPIGRPRKNAGFIWREREITRNIPARPAQPFFRPGIEAARTEIRARWAEGMRKAMARAKK
jgi:hypothetical protein